MRKRILGSIAALAASAGAAWGQTPPAPLGGATFPAWQDAAPGSGGMPGAMPPGETPLLSPGTPPVYPPPGPYLQPRIEMPPPSATGYGDAPRWWFSGEYLLWFTRSQPIPYPLVTTSAPNQFGILGQPSTVELVPAKDIPYNAISGFRFNAGFYGDADRRFGPWINAFYTEEKGIHRQFSSFPVGAVSEGVPVIARPFIDTELGQTSLVLTGPEFAVGGIKVSTSTSTWGIEAAGLWNIFRSHPDAKVWQSLDLIAGYKFLQNREQIVIESVSFLNNYILEPIFVPGPFGFPVQIGTELITPEVPLAGVNIVFPAMFQIIDRITTRNRFNGGVFGLRHELRYGMWNLMTTGKIGIGNIHQVLDIQGHTAFGNFQTARMGSSYGGLFANAATIGRYSNDEFGIIPELTANLGIYVTRSLMVYAGYNFIWINRVLRPGLHLNPVIDASTLPASLNYGEPGRIPTPRLQLRQDELWLHGVNFGLQLRY